MKKYIALAVAGLVLGTSAFSASNIGNDALRRNSIPCNRKGESYKNCRAGQPSNPYNRNCLKVKQCRS